MIDTSEILVSKEHIDPLRDSGFVIYKLGRITPVVDGKREAKMLWGNVKDKTLSLIKTAMSVVGAGTEADPVRLDGDEEIVETCRYYRSDHGVKGWFYPLVDKSVMISPTCEAIELVNDETAPARNSFYGTRHAFAARSWLKFQYGTSTEVYQVDHGLAVGDFISINADGTWFKTIATSLESACTVGFVYELIHSPFAPNEHYFSYCTYGRLNNAVWDVPDFEIGKKYYLSNTTAGAVMVEPETWQEGDIFQYIGIGTKDGLEVNIEPAYVYHAQPVPTINENGNWWIGETDTGVKAQGTNGADGTDGEDGKGIQSHVLFATNGRVKTYRITYTDNTTFDYDVTDGADGSGGSTTVQSGGGMDFEEFSTTGQVVMGMPSEVNSTTVNEVTEHSHTHKLGKVSLDKLVKGIPVEYGALYNWYSATDARKISSSDDWNVLSKNICKNIGQYLDETAGDYLSIYCGGKLKETGFDRWDSPNTGATNESGFNGIAGGMRSGEFGFLKEYLYLAGIDEFNSESCYITVLRYDNTEFNWNTITPKTSGVSIRIYRECTESELLLSDGIVPIIYTGNNLITYRCCKIGNFIVTIDHLNETKFRNGDWIHGYDNGVYTPISNEDWTSLDHDGMCYFDENEANGGGEIPLENLLISEHNKLQGLQGGDAENDEFYHLTAAEKTLIESFLALPTYADNDAAIIGGLQAGQLYKTSTGQLMIV